MTSNAYPENPFASTHSLDTNPFDDPTPTSQPPSYPLSQTSLNKADTIAQREAALDARERELNARQERLQQHGKNNWPFFYPLIFHSIQDEIPEDSRGLILRLYQLWMALGVTLIVNFIACIFILLSGSHDGGRDVGASAMYLPVIFILAFLLWYRPIYNGYMKEQSLYYYLYFFFAGWHILFSGYMVIGIPSTGSAGLIQTVGLFVQHHWVAAILGTIASAGWVLQAFGSVFYFRQIWAHHNSQGHSIQKAKTELATHGAKSYFARG